LNFIDNFGFGIGFQQLGFIGKDGEVMVNIIHATLGKKLCLLDGGTVAAKLVNEFGIFAIAALSLYVIYAIKYSIRLRELSIFQRSFRDAINVFYFSIFIMFGIDLFFRGTGYFSASAFLFIASMIWIRMEDSKSTGVKA